MKKVLSFILLSSLAATSGAYAACDYCNWKNCKKHSNWVGRVVRKATCRLRHRKNNKRKGEENGPCSNENCTRCNPDNKSSENFCTNCGKYICKNCGRHHLTQNNA